LELEKLPEISTKIIPNIKFPKQKNNAKASTHLHRYIELASITYQSDGRSWRHEHLHRPILAHQW